MDDTHRRREEMRDGDADTAACGQWSPDLYRTLAKGGLTNQNGSLVILERARDQFRSAGAAAVDQDHHRHIRRDGMARRIQEEILRAGLAFFNRDRPRFDEVACDVDR